MSSIKAYGRVANLVMLGVSLIILTVSFAIKDLPTNKTYRYENNTIVSYSWHDVFENVMAFFSVVLTIVLITFAVFVFFQNMRTKQEKLLRVIIQSACIYFVCLVVIMISNILVIGLYGNEAYDPSYYEFSNEKNTVVIEEKSFLLYGGGSIYQVYEDKSAVELARFSTDDGGRNNGDYDILWKAESVEITYKTFTGNNGKNTIKVLLR